MSSPQQVARSFDRGNASDQEYFEVMNCADFTYEQRTIFPRDRQQGRMRIISSPSGMHITHTAKITNRLKAADPTIVDGPSDPE